MDYSPIYWIQTVSLVIALVMIATARKGFNGFALMFVLLGLMLIVMRIDKATGLIGEPGLSIETSLAVAFFCWQALSIWKDRRDHSEYLHWREQWAEELKLIREWQARRAEQDRRIAALEQAQAEDEARHGKWDYKGAMAEQTRNLIFPKR